MNVTVDKSTLSQLLQTCLRLVLQATAKLYGFIVQEGMKKYCQKRWISAAGLRLFLRDSERTTRGLEPSG